ncbi:MAG TPA: signal peptidase II [Chloroflexota bacterium]|nr:signal peptidase II [Chloroflexota bacterium]HUM68687.1 signal peptidase II [Chloroflexota bacterium]
MIYFLIPLAFLADRLGKWWAAAYLAEHGPTQFNTLFTLVETYNRGIAFGLFQGIGPLVGWLTLAVLAGLVIYIHRLPREQWLARAGLAILIGGALGNLVDRIFWGEVLDFIQTPWRVGIFNVGDMMIHLGMGLFILGSILQRQKEEGETAVTLE